MCRETPETSGTEAGKGKGGATGSLVVLTGKDRYPGAPLEQKDLLDDSKSPTR